MSLACGDKLPFPLDCAILLKVGFAASKLTIHFSPFQADWGGNVVRRDSLTGSSAVGKASCRRGG
jgi:hypothetical protein